MGDKRGKKGGRAKPTNEQREASEGLKRFNSELERKGIQVEDPTHPLAGLPDDRLRNAIRWALEDGGTSMKRFLETFAEINNVGFTRQSLNKWLRESSTIAPDRLGFIVDMLARYMAEEMAGRLSGEIVNEASVFGCVSEYPEEPDVNRRYDAAYSLIVDCLFGLARPDRINLKRFAVIAALMEAEEAELDAVGSVLTCHMRPAFRWGKKTAREALADVRGIGPNESMTEVAEGVARDLFEAGGLENIGELMDWAGEVREFAEERMAHEADYFGDVPF